MKVVTLAHGNGGRFSHELVEKIFVKKFDNHILSRLEDSAVLSDSARSLAFTTDAFVIKPLFFPGGDIGKLAVCGTVNDLAVSGAEPRYLSASFIIEEGFFFSDLQKIVSSMEKAAHAAGVVIVAGDTKVVEKGGADGLFITTSGIGFLPEQGAFSPLTMKPGDRVIVSGMLGDHAVAVMKARGDFPVSHSIESDVASVAGLVKNIVARIKRDDIRIMRDPTRGGLATTLSEFARTSRFSIEIDEERLPVRDQVRALCELTGFDPLYLANEGKVVIVCAEEKKQDILDIMHDHHLGVYATCIGELTDDPLARVYLRTRAGGTRILDMLTHDMLPRIC